MGLAKRRATKIQPKTVGGSIFGLFSNFDKCGLEVADKVISGVVDVNVCVKFGNSTLNRADLFDSLPVGPCFTHFHAVLSCNLQQTGSS